MSLRTQVFNGKRFNGLQVHSNDNQTVLDTLRKLCYLTHLNSTLQSTFISLGPTLSGIPRCDRRPTSFADVVDILRFSTSPSTCSQEPTVNYEPSTID